MTRPIKFRAWDKINKEWCIDLHSVTVNGHAYFCGAAYHTGSIEVTQFTGMHDKNEKEIWEGDICKASMDEQWFFGEIIFKFGAFTLKDRWTLRFIEIEVIGNIFENPELLEEK